MRDSARPARRITGLRADFEDQLAALVEIPSVSMDPGARADMRRCATLAVVYLRESAPRSRWSTPADRRSSSAASSAIRRSRRSPSTTTSTCSRPTETEPGRREPFSFTREGRHATRGRGTHRRQGPGAHRALRRAGRRCEAGVPVNIHFLWEMEEEIGCPHFEAADGAIAGARRRGRSRPTRSSSPTRSGSRAARPALSLGLRGLQGFTVRLETGARPTSTRAPPAARRATRSPSCAGCSPRCFDARTGR